jgi:competence protein ComEC
MKRPLAAPCVLFIGGIIFGEFSGWSFTVFLAGASLFVLSALLWPAQRQLMLAAGIFATGAAALALQTRVIAPHDLRNVVGTETRLATVRGKLVEAPYQRFYEDQGRSFTKLECAEIRFKDTEWQHVAGTIAVVTPGPIAANLWHGQIAEVTGMLAQPAAALAPGLFDYRAYLRRLDIHYALRASSANDWKVLGSTQPPLAVRFNAWAKKTLAYGLPSEDEPLRLLWAMTLGWKTALNGETSEPFMRSGTLHVFAISGLHIAMIAAIIAGLLRGLGCRRRLCAVVVIPIVWFYTYATGWQASAVRSAVMATVVFGSWIFNRPPDLFNSLAGAALIILVFDPQQLFQAGFQLSFAVVFCLALFGNYFRDFKDPIASGDPLIPWEVRPWWQRKWLGGVRYATGMAITALAAWLGSIPLTAHYFHLFTPVSVIANFIVVPMSGLALAGNLASIFFGAWCPAACDILNNSAWFWMKAMLVVSEWTARWPGAAFHVSAPGPFVTTFYYSVLIAITARWVSTARWRPWVWTAIAVLGLASTVEIARQCSRTTLTVLPLSGGHSIFMDAPGIARDVLIDCGDEDVARIIVKPFLQSRGVVRLPHLVLTHGDADHVAGADYIIETFEPKQIVTSAAKFKSPFYRQVTRDRPIVQVAPRGEVANWSVLYPNPDEDFPLADDKALVLRATIKGITVLLLPDLSPTAQNALLQRQIDIRSDIVITSISPAGEPLCDELLDQMEARLIVVADATTHDARARPPVRQRLSERAVPVFYASEAGAITIDFRSRQATVIPTWRSEGAKPFVLTQVARASPRHN